MQSPGALSDASRAKADSKSQSHKQNTKERPKAQECPAHFAVYDGRLRVGTVYQVGADFTAIVAGDEREIGTFPSLKAAADAVDVAYEGER